MACCVGLGREALLSCPYYEEVLENVLQSLNWVHTLLCYV